MRGFSRPFIPRVRRKTSGTTCYNMYIHTRDETGVHIDIDAATAVESALLFDGRRELRVKISTDIFTINSVHRQRGNSYHNFLRRRVCVRRRLLE